MSTMVKKGSVKLLVVACVLACLVGIFMPLTASATPIIDAFFPTVSPSGQEITESEAFAAMAQYFEENNVVLNVDALGLYDFVYNEEYNYVEVYADGIPFDIIYQDTDGVYHSYYEGWSVTLPSNDIGAIVETTLTGVRGVFDMAAEAFLFLTSNDMCMFMIAVTFGGIAIAFVGRSFKTARK